jgi:hypothetical protein
MFLLEDQSCSVFRICASEEVGESQVRPRTVVGGIKKIRLGSYSTTIQMRSKYKAVADSWIGWSIVNRRRRFVVSYPVTRDWLTVDASRDRERPAHRATYTSNFFRSPFR